jgi:hypothetical protein
MKKLALKPVGKLALLVTLLFTFLTTANGQSIPPQIIIQKVSDAIEGGTNGQFRVALNYPVPVAENITINFSYVSTPPTATPTVDFALLGISAGNTITIPAGATEVYVDADAGNDGVIEGPEMVGIKINTATSTSQTYTIDTARDSAIVLIVDANSASSTPLQIMTGTNGAEPATNGSFTVKLAGVATSAWPVSVGIRFTGTATVGVDFQSIAQITIPPNTNIVSVPFTIFDDHVIEPTETFTITILSGSATDGGGNAFIFPPDPANDDITINLTDNDNVTANKLLTVTKITDAAEPSTNGLFSVNLPSDYRSSGNITLSYTLTGTATQGTDYTVGTVSLPAYRNVIQVPVVTVDNAVIESTETVIFSIVNGSTDANGFAYLPNPGFSTDTMNLIDDDVPLSLHLLSFEGRQQGENIQLNWTTADEHNTDHFKILHSTDGRQFKAVGTVQAMGSGNHQYTFTDVQAEHKNYYRLHMVDKDGQATYSNIISIEKDQHIQATTAYPNPAKGQVTLTIGDDQLLHTKATLTDACGQLRQIIYITGHSQVISLNNYAAGIYFLKMENGENIKLILE